MCQADPSVVVGTGGGVGEWPSHMFMGSGGNFATVRDTSGGLFIGNDGQGTQPANSAAEKCGLGNPIIPSTGNKLEPEIDFATNGEVPLFLKRTYNRYWGYKGLFGYNWLSNFDLKLVVVPEAQLIAAYRSDGRMVYYNYQTTPTPAWYETKAQAVSRIVSDGSGGYILYTDNDGTETYNSAGQITSIKNQHGIGVTFVYSGGKLQQAVHTSGRSMQFGWTGDQVTSVTDPAGNVFTYSYIFKSTIALLSTAVQPGTPSTTTTYHYEGMGTELTGKSLNGTRYSTFAYDSGGRATSSEHSSGADKNTFAYSDANGIRTVVHTNPLGKVTTFKYKDGKLQSETGNPSTYCPDTLYREITYDTNGYENIASDFTNGIVDFDYNTKGQLLKKTEAAGTAYARVTEYVWDTAKNRVIQETIAGLRRADYTYTANNRIESVKTTNLSSVGVAGQFRTTNYSYTTHPNGMLASSVVDGPLQGSQDAVTSAYDTLGNLTSVSNGLGHAVTYSNYNGLGLPGRIVGVNGAITDYTYDARGRLLSETSYVGSTPYTTAYTYDNRGRKTSSTDPDNVTTSYFYDNNNRLTKITRPEPGSPYASQMSSLTGPTSSVGTQGQFAVEGGLGGGGTLAPMACHPQPDCEIDPDPEPPLRSAGFIDQNVPTTMVAGQTYAITLRMINGGRETWTAATNHNLGSANPLDNTTWGLHRVAVPGSVATGQTATFNFNITAPSTAGSYNFQWRMVRDGVAWFGAFTPNTVITVQPAPTNGASLSSKTIPSAVETGKPVTFSVTMLNSGSTTWTPDLYFLSPTNGANYTLWNMSWGTLSGPVAPGQTATFNIPATAPAVGNYSLQWSMIKYGVEWFGPLVNASIAVQPPPPPPVGFQKFSYNLNGDVAMIETGIESGSSTLVLSRAYIDYDELGRVRARRGSDTNGNSPNVRYTYDGDGRIKTVTDSLNRVTTLTYDALGRPITSTDPRNGVTRFEYDSGDFLIKVVDPRNLATTYARDGFGQVWSQSSPDTGTTTFQYNAQGLRTGMNRADGSGLVYQYDDLGRLTWYGSSGPIATTGARPARVCYAVLAPQPVQQIKPGRTLPIRNKVSYGSVAMLPVTEATTLPLTPTMAWGESLASATRAGSASVMAMRTGGSTRSRPMSEARQSTSPQASSTNPSAR